MRSYKKYCKTEIYRDQAYRDHLEKDTDAKKFLDRFDDEVYGESFDLENPENDLYQNSADKRKIYNEANARKRDFFHKLNNLEFSDEILVEPNPENDVDEQLKTVNAAKLIEVLISQTLERGNSKKEGFTQDLLLSLVLGSYKILAVEARYRRKARREGVE